ncbi:MAG TPA: hypothetical protein VM425_07710 [Myxococcota bacterium]|nr:hypothetical protein [Myxococcota bacterium]
MSLDKHVTVRIAEDYHRRLMKHALTKRVTVGELAREFIIREMERLEGKRDLEFDPEIAIDMFSTLLAMEEILVREFDHESLKAVRGDKARMIKDIYSRAEVEARNRLHLLDKF